MPLSSIVLGAVISAGEQLGIVGAKVLLSAGFSPDDLEDTSELIDDQDAQRLLDALVAQSGEPLLGLKLAERCGEHSLHLFGQLLLASPSLRHAAMTLQDLGPSMIGGPSVRLHIERDEARLQLQQTYSGTSAQFIAEFLLSILCKMALRFAGADADLVQSVQFARPRPYYVESSMRVLGVQASFGHGVHALKFAPALLDRSAPGTHPHVLSALRRLAHDELIVPRNDRSWTARVGTALKRSRDLAHVDFTQIARQTGVTLRTLRRRVQAENTTLSDILDRMRAERATAQLGLPEESIKLVAEQLGYAEASSFHRAFKRWTGMTPSAYRRRAQLTSSVH